MSGTKSDLLLCVSELVPHHDMVKAHEAHMVILDGAAVVNMIKPRTPVSLIGTSRRSWNMCDANWKDILKAATRTKRGKGIRMNVEVNKQVPSNWQEFLRIDENKSALFHLISDRLVDGEFPGQVIVTRDDEVLSSVPCDLVGLMSCTHEDSHNRMFVHATDGAEHGTNKILLRTVDTERIVLGDFNICELHEQSHFLKEYRGILTENTMCQLIREPTRVTDRTATLLDHILVSREDVIQQSGVVPIGISDHELIYCTRKITHQRFGGHVTIRSRSIKHYSKDLLLERLNKTDWVPVLSCLDTNAAWQTFESCMKTIIDSLAPLKQRRIKSNSEPWVNAKILESIRERNTSLHKFRKSKDARDYGEYRKHNVW